MTALGVLLYTISNIIFLGIGVCVGYYMYSRTELPEPSEIPELVKDKIRPVEVGAIRMPSAEDLRRKNDPDREAKEEVAKTIEKLNKDDDLLMSMQSFYNNE